MEEKRLPGLSKEALEYLSGLEAKSYPTAVESSSEEHQWIESYKVEPDIWYRNGASETPVNFQLDFLANPKLKSVAWHNASNSNIAQVLSDAFLAQKLHRLDLTRDLACDPIHAVHYKQIESKYPLTYDHLADLELNRAVFADRPVLKWIATACPRLRFLSLMCTGMRDARPLRKLKNLELLYLDNNYLGSESINTFLHLPKLTDLSLDTNWLDDADVRKLLASTSLQQLRTRNQRTPHHISVETLMAVDIFINKQPLNVPELIFTEVAQRMPPRPKLVKRAQIFELVDTTGISNLKALYDQYPQTTHLECVVDRSSKTQYLRKKFKRLTNITVSVQDTSRSMWQNLAQSPTVLWMVIRSSATPPNPDAPQDIPYEIHPSFAKALRNNKILQMLALPSKEMLTLEVARLLVMTHVKTLDGIDPEFAYIQDDQYYRNLMQNESIQMITDYDFRNDFKDTVLGSRIKEQKITDEKVVFVIKERIHHILEHFAETKRRRDKLQQVIPTLAAFKTNASDRNAIINLLPQIYMFAGIIPTEPLLIPVAKRKEWAQMAEKVAPLSSVVFKK
jgi:hypothetical protein